jgi:hypothetical protein
MSEKQKEEKTVDATQKVETNAYVPTYNVKPEFKAAVLRTIGKYPYNQIAGIMNAINVPVMDHQTLTQVINVLGNFPYAEINSLISTINDYVEQVIEE